MNVTLTHLVMLIFLTIPSHLAAQQIQESAPQPAELAARVTELETRVKVLEELVAKLTSNSPEKSRPKSTETQTAPAIDSPLVLDDWSYSVVHGDFGQSYYAINLTLRNTGTKRIKLIEGSVIFNDLLDTKVLAIKITPDIVIAPGTSVINSDNYPINPFIADATRMAAMKKEDIKPKMVISRIVFDDNSVIKVGR
ncbi:MAG: hypothetical protein ABL888_14810 [Pirellulaceae bacterium]